MSLDLIGMQKPYPSPPMKKQTNKPQFSHLKLNLSINLDFGLEPKSILESRTLDANPKWA